MDHKKGIAFAIVTAVLWGLLAIGIKVVLVEVDPITVVWVRMMTAAGGLALYFALKKPQAFSVFSKPPKLIWLPAVGLALNYIGYAKGIDLAGPASAQVVIQSGPVILCLAGFFIFHEKFVIRQKIGLVVAFVGLLFFYSRQLSSMEVGQEYFMKGVLFTFGGAMSWSLYSISQKSIVKSYPVQWVNMFIYTFSAIVYAPFVDFSVFAHLSIWMWLGLLFLGLNTLVAYGCMGEALKYTDAGKISVIIILNPIITFVLLQIMEQRGVTWIAYEQIPFWAYVGATLMLLGAILATVRSKQRN